MYARSLAHGKLQNAEHSTKLYPTEQPDNELEQAPPPPRIDERRSPSGAQEVEVVDQGETSSVTVNTKTSNSSQGGILPKKGMSSFYTAADHTTAAFRMQENSSEALSQQVDAIYRHTRAGAAAQASNGNGARASIRGSILSKLHHHDEGSFEVDFDGTVGSAKRPSIISNYGDRSNEFTRRSFVSEHTQRIEKRRSTLHDRLMSTSKSERYMEPATYDDDVEDVMIDGVNIFERYEPKPANSKLRWNLLWLLILVLSPYPIWLTFVDCALSYEITFIVNCVMTLNFIYTTILCWRYMWRMIRSFNTPFWQELDPDLREQVQHLVVVPTYKEPVELLLVTLSSIANQTVAHSIVVVVGMEEKTPDKEEKKRIIREHYGDAFKALVFTVHPFGQPGEIAGACSNRNWAARGGLKFMIKAGLIPVDPETKELSLDFTVVTVCDSDTTFFSRYFENLTWLFLNEPAESRYHVCWQSPLFYNIALDERWFFTRVMGILRSYFMVGFLIGADINTMSIYSMSLSLLVSSKFFHPGYQMDDIIYTLSAMKATGKRIRIRCIDIPTLSGPTSGADICEEWKEWVVQATRWTIGAAEVFHYFFIKLIKGVYFLPGFAYFWWFVYYYGFVLCFSGMVAITNLIAQFVSIGYSQYSIDTCRPLQTWFNLPDDWPYAWIFPAFLFFNYAIVFFTAFCMDALVSQILALNERIGLLRNFCHFVSTTFVLWAYCMVEYKAIIQIAIHGKKVCGHIASDKGNLVAKKADENKEEKV